MTNFEMVKEFHEALRVPTGIFPGIIDDDRMELRIDLIDEEFCETQKAMFANDLIEISDGLADLLYVVYGTAAEYGIDIDEVFKEVHRSNMSKLETCGDCNGSGSLRGGHFRNQPNHTLIIDCPSCRGQGSKPILREDGKVLKGPNYSPPDIKAVLDRQFLRD